MDYIEEKIAEVDAQIAEDHQSQGRSRRMQAFSMALNVAVMAGEIYLAITLGVSGWGWLYILAIAITVATMIFVVLGWRRLRVTWREIDRLAALTRAHLVAVNEKMDQHVRDHPAPSE